MSALPTPAAPPGPATRRAWSQRLLATGDQWLRVALSHYVTNGLSVTVGLVLIMLLVFAVAGVAGAASAAVGVMITSLPDVAAPRRRKIMQMLPAPLLGVPLFMLTQLLRTDDALLGLLLVAGTFGAVMMMAWGKRGGPITFSLLFSMLFSMAAPPPPTFAAVLVHVAWFCLGALLYLLWAVLTTHLLNARYRTQMLAECMHLLAQLLRTQSERFAPEADAQALLATMLEQQAALADRLQDTRDVVLESPTNARRTCLAGLLLSVLEARDHLLACDLDLDTLQLQAGDTQALPTLQQVLNTTATQLERLSMSLLLGRPPQAIAPIANQRALLVGALPARPDRRPPLVPPPVHLGEPDDAALLHNIADRVGHINDEAVRMAALARGDEQAELAAVRTQWQLFVSPTRWALAPLLKQLAWQAPVLRYALRATLAVGVGYWVSLHLPWAAHKYWILTTILVVMRGNLAQTMQRRNDRVLGTLIGCMLVMGLLSLHPEAALLFVVVALGMGLAHAFALRRYLFTSIFGTLAGLLQAHLLLVGAAPTFAIAERLGDTLLGALLAWLFSYVLPTWERGQLPGLVQRSVRAQLQHAKGSLKLAEPDGTPQKVLHTTDLAWRLARKEAYDSLSALTLATQRSLAEPRQVRPPLVPLESLQARSYQLLAQLTAVKSLLTLRRSQLNMALAMPALALAEQQITQALGGSLPEGGPAGHTPAGPTTPASQSVAVAPPPADQPQVAGQPYQQVPDHLVSEDLTPWLLRRLTLAVAMARELQRSAAMAQQAMSAA
ncbi:FUSC family membrane protein [Variovorax sp. HJSM1_2]|uniref:FUSC family protein n=1 Tax=Variovorax sp. HJSM1_2 TaxID=3366263 RepID=UPI003BBC5A12